MTRRPTLRHIIIGLALCLALGGGIALYTLTRTPAVAPTYPTLLPSQKSIHDLGGWQRISPPNKEPVFAYADTVEGVRLNVSQQRLPDTFKGDIAGNMAELAKNFQATTRLDVGGTVVYIGTSAKGPQSALFTKNNLLIFIKSEKTISDAAWSTYISSLQTSTAQ